MAVCDCGAEVPDEDGPGHAYMRPVPGCWRRYGQLMVRLLQPGQAGSRVTHVDAYAAQHPAGAEVERRQRQSVAVHLVALCAHLERGVPEPLLTRLRGSLSETVLPATGLADWPALAPPRSFGQWNAPALVALPDDALEPAVAAWAQEVWAAWSDQHERVRAWTDMALAARPVRRHA